MSDVVNDLSISKSMDCIPVTPVTGAWPQVAAIEKPLADIRLLGCRGRKRNANRNVFRVSR